MKENILKAHTQLPLFIQLFPVNLVKHVVCCVTTESLFHNICYHDFVPTVILGQMSKAKFV